MNWLQYMLAVLIFDIILVPPLLVMVVTANLFWLRSIAAKLGKLGLPFIAVAVFALASSFGFWFIHDEQQPRERSAFAEDPAQRDDCERYPGIYGC